MNNQKIKSDGGKPKLSLVPRQIIKDIAKVREYGNKKYPEGGPDNWKMVEPERYRDALFRHLLLYLDDPYGVDEESGLKHLSHIACNVAFLCELEKDGPIDSFNDNFRMKVYGKPCKFSLCKNYICHHDVCAKCQDLDHFEEKEG